MPSTPPAAKVFIHGQVARPVLQPALEWTQEEEAHLRRLIEERTLTTSAEGFKLASGRHSSFIFNLKNLYGDPEAASLITRRLLATLADLECDYIAGLELGAVPPVVAAVMASHGSGNGVRGFIIRKDAKGHGTKNRIEGLTETDPRDGTVVVIDDVTTTGNSLVQAVEVARELGFTVTQAITLVDREEGAVDELANKGVELIPLYQKSDFLGPDVL